MLGIVAGPPGDAAALLSTLHRAVPAVQDILRQVFRLPEILRLSGQVIRLDEFTDEPLLIVIDIVPASDGCASFGFSPVHPVHRPVAGLGEGRQRESSAVIIQPVHQLVQQLGIPVVVSGVQGGVALGLIDIQALQDGVHRLDGAGIHPDRAVFVILVGPVVRIVVAVHRKSVRLVEVILHSGVRECDGTLEVPGRGSDFLLLIPSGGIPAAIRGVVLLAGRKNPAGDKARQNQ